MNDETIYYLRLVRGRELLRAPVSPDDFVTITGANETLFVLVGLEEKIELLVGNYAEYERELVSLGIDHTVWGDEAWMNQRGAHRLISRRLANLLSTARLYLDQTGHGMSALFGDNSEALARFNEVRAREYDSHFAYRALEALRNHIQHRSIPVHSLSFQEMLNLDVEPPTIKRAVSPAVDPDKLAADGKFKSAILREFRARGESVPITPLVRQYVECITRIHATVRQFTAPLIAASESALLPIIQRAAVVLGDDLSKVELIVEHTGSVTVQRLPFMHLIAEQRALRRRNVTLSKLSVTYVTAEPPATAPARKQTG